MFPEPVESILAWWLPRVTAVLGDELLGVTLTGSAALGDYNEGWSDVDVCVVTANGTRAEIAPLLGGIHDDMREVYRRKSEWRSGQYVEGYYVSRELALRRRSEDWSYVAGGTTRRHCLADPITPFDRYLLSHYGVAVAGEPTCFPPPLTHELAAQTRSDLATLQKYRDQSALWLCGMLHWLARTIVYWRDGQMLSKTQALEREIAGGSMYREAFEMALAARREGSASAHKFREPLLQRYPAIAPRAYDEVMAYTEAAGTR